MNNIIERFRKTTASLFPGFELISEQYGNVTNHAFVPNYLRFGIPPENSCLKNSPYFYKKNSIVHFTSFNALTSILQEKAIRLYNLHNLNDPREFTFASKIFNLSKEMINDAKDNLFIMSFCEKTIFKKVPDEFNLWRLYGLQGKGVTIVFSIVNDPVKWIDFHISKIIYGTKNRNNFEKLAELLAELGHYTPKVDIDFCKLYAFHKSRLFLPEAEVRILFDGRKNRTGFGGPIIRSKGETVFPIIKQDLFKLLDSRDEVLYLQIPIQHKNLKSKREHIPVLKIDEIVIGYNFEEVEKIINQIKQLCNNALGYEPIIKQTKLAKYYWDIHTK